MTQTDYQKLALKWAPINYQYVILDKDKIKKSDLSHDIQADLSYDTKRDLLVPINLDGFSNTCKCGYMKHEHAEFSKTQTISKNKSKKHGPCLEYSPKYNTPEDAWDTRNMRNRLKTILSRNLIPVAYYSIASTTNYFYILYSFFHADDEKHQNDMEGCLVIIERDCANENNDRLVGMLTVSHIFFPRYVYKDRLDFDPTGFFARLDEIKGKSPKEFEKFREMTSKDLDVGMKTLSKRIDSIKKKMKIEGFSGKMEAEDETDSERALIQQEFAGHGLYALGADIVFPYMIKRKWLQLQGKLDILMFYPSLEPMSYNVENLVRYKGMPHLKSFYYLLVDIHEDDNHNGLCHWMNSEKTFTSKGYFHGDKAKPPWKWVETDGKNVYYLWKNPAELADFYFSPKKNESGFVKPFIDPIKDRDENGNVRYIKTMDQISDGLSHTCKIE